MQIGRVESEEVVFRLSGVAEGKEGEVFAVPAVSVFPGVEGFVGP